MTKKVFFAALSCAFLATSCQEEELGFTQEEIFRGAYERNFTQTFGEVDPGQSWDFTTRAYTQYESVAEKDGVNKGYYVVENATLNWFKNYMKEGENNSSKVKSFTLKTTEATTFEIVPLYQGGAYYNWDVEIVVNGEVSSAWKWSKGDGKLEAQYNSTKWYAVEKGNSKNNTHAATDASTATRSKTTQIDVSANSTIYFRITNLDKNSRGNYTSGSRQGEKNESPYTSIQNPTYIGLLDSSVGLDIPSNVAKVNSEYSAMIITCEGYYNQGSSPDFNEVAFMIVGYIPQVIFNEEEREITTASKRYQCEDFGTAGHWDFNDIVVDVRETTKATWKINTETGEETIDRTKPIVNKQFAKIAHLCGTFPIQVKVGDYTFAQITDPTNQTQTMAQLSGKDDAGNSVCENAAVKVPGWDPNYEVEITGYDAAQNNIEVYVWQTFNISASSTNQNEVYVNKFPKQGTIPYMVATKTSDPWTDENVSVETMDWWSLLPEATK